MHIAVDTLGNLLSVVVTAANEQERDQVAALAMEVQEATGGTVELAYADQGDTGQAAERTFGWLGRFRRATRDYERLSDPLAGYHGVAALTLLLSRIVH